MTSPGRSRLEPAGYAAVAVGLLVLLYAHLRDVDGFYLDEWMYTHGAEYMWDRFPGGVLGEIPNWTRGPQRLYSLLLMPLWGPLATPAAYALSHVLNALLLVSTVVPTALLARRVVARPVLRVLAVALAVAVPWLVIGANVLTENLAFPLLMWTVYAIVAAAEAPTAWNQLAALAAAGALMLTRLNLGVMFGVLVLAIVVAELLARGSGARAIARRRAPLLAAALLLLLLGAAVVARGGVGFGAYGGFTGPDFLSTKWAQRDAILTTALLYTRALVTGSFVFPFVIGVAAALAALRGALGPGARIPALVALSAWLGVVLVVAVWTVGAAFEERYAFYVCAPLAVFAVAGAEHLRRIWPELIAASAVAVWALARGAPLPGANSAHFFAAPAESFWARVLEYRLLLVDRDLLGWLPLADNSWMPVAVALAVFVAVVVAHTFLGPRRLPLGAVVASGLALCLVAQVLSLNYDFGRLLYGTTEMPGGLAGGPGHGERDDWIDDAVPDGERVALVPPPFTVPVGAAERIEFWNRSIDGVVALGFVGAGAPASAGHEIVASPLGEGGLAGWEGTSYEWLAGQRDDPRVQFAGTPAARAESFELIRLEQGSAPAIWTADGLEADLYLRERGPVTMTLARERARDVRAVVLRLRAADPIEGTVGWSVRRDGRPAARGRLGASGEQTVRLRVPPCPPAGACGPVTWTLAVRGAAADVPLAIYGPAEPRDPVSLQLLAAHLERPGTG